jgi:Mn2+/Fe2+ NRAMP family transporter
MSERHAENRHPVLRALGLGLITGAADDDCSAIGTYAQAGAQLGCKILWTAPITFPMMVAVVYLSGKLGQVAGQGLFSVLREHHSKWFVYTVLTGVIIGNTIEAGADIGGIAAGLGILVPWPRWIIVVAVTLVVLVLQVWGSYTLIRNVFRILALSLGAYIVSAFMAHPNWGQVAHGSLVPTLHFSRDFLSMLVAIIGTSLSAYLYTWQSNEEVEEERAMGRHTVEERRGATDDELRTSFWDITLGMLFSNVVMYFIILAAAATLFVAGKRDISTAVDAAQALKPLAGRAAGLLFTLGLVGVGFLAVPVMTTGAAYDLSQTLGWDNGLHHKPSEAKKFYWAVAIFTLLAMGMNFLGINPMRALVIAGIVQGFSTPPLMLLIMRMTNNPAIMGDRVNGRAINILGWFTTASIFLASAGLVVSWFWH